LGWSVLIFWPFDRLLVLSWSKVTGAGRLAPAWSDTMRFGRAEVQKTVLGCVSRRSAQGTAIDPRTWDKRQCGRILSPQSLPRITAGP
jgi:hypothetical protein